MITKTRNSTTKKYACSFNQESGYSWTSPTVVALAGNYNVIQPSETIVYDTGPRIIHQPYPHPNWKYCEHYQATPAYAAVSFEYDKVQWLNSVYHFDMHSRTGGVNVFEGNWDFPATPAMPSLDLKDLADRMYADLAGRVDSYFLSLEDLAGFFSGNSLFKAIKYAGSASSIFARSIRDLRRLKRAFGARTSLYNMWLSSKELVKAACGLDLASRFSFKATLNDIVELVDLVTSATSQLQRLQLRNDREVMRYTKDATAENTNEAVVPGTTVKTRLSEVFRHHVDYSPHTIQQLPATLFKEGRLIAKSKATARCYCWARVRYPQQYLTTSRILQDGLGLSKPLSTLWAIVPCSFLIDYLLRIEERLARLDNALNEVGVWVDIKDSWVVMTKNSYQRIVLPPAQFATSSGRDTESGSFSGCDATRHIQKDFYRYPFGTADIMNSVGPLLRVQQDNWLRRIGTGLEILVQRR